MKISYSKSGLALVLTKEEKNAIVKRYGCHCFRLEFPKSNVVRLVPNPAMEAEDQKQRGSARLWKTTGPNDTYRWQVRGNMPQLGGLFGATIIPGDSIQYENDYFEIMVPEVRVESRLWNGAQPKPRKKKLPKDVPDSVSDGFVALCRARDVINDTKRRMGKDMGLSIDPDTDLLKIIMEI